MGCPLPIYGTGASGRTSFATHNPECRSEGAIRTYQHYLALRYDPDPQLQPEADEVRAELAQLLGER